MRNSLWITGFLESGILKSRKKMFRKLNLFPSSGEGWETSVGPFRKSFTVVCVQLVDDINVARSVKVTYSSHIQEML
jgi:hypothetical protein